MGYCCSDVLPGQVERGHGRGGTYVPVVLHRPGHLRHVVEGHAPHPVGERARGTGQRRGARPRGRRHRPGARVTRSGIRRGHRFGARAESKTAGAGARDGDRGRDDRRRGNNAGRRVLRVVGQTRGLGGTAVAVREGSQGKGVILFAIDRAGGRWEGEGRVPGVRPVHGDLIGRLGGGHVDRHDARVGTVRAERRFGRLQARRGVGEIRHLRGARAGAGTALVADRQNGVAAHVLHGEGVDQAADTRGLRLREGAVGSGDGEGVGRCRLVGAGHRHRDVGRGPIVAEGIHRFRRGVRDHPRHGAGAVDAAGRARHVGIGRTAGIVRHLVSIGRGAVRQEGRRVGGPGKRARRVEGIVRRAARHVEGDGGNLGGKIALGRRVRRHKVGVAAHRRAGRERRGEGRRKTAVGVRHLGERVGARHGGARRHGDAARGRGHGRRLSGTAVVGIVHGEPGRARQRQ